MKFPLPSFDFYRRMSARERALSLIVAGTVLAIVNLIAISTLLRASRDLRAQYADKSQELHVQSMYAQEQPMWKQRTDWLKVKQPRLMNRDRAGTDLLVEVQTAARVNGVTLTTFQITPLQRAIPGQREAEKSEYQAVSLSIETQSDWSGLVRFLASLQRPEGFVVFDRATLRTESNDASRMTGSFNISKWYASSVK